MNEVRDITIIAVGGIKSAATRVMCETYLKRMAPFAKICVFEIPAEPFTAEAQKEKSKKKESEKILKALKKYGSEDVVLLDEKGIQMDSDEFSRFLFSENAPHVFVVGGALGFDRDTLAGFKNRIALSKMTFPHELARMFLFEQIYRAITISKGKEYHY